MTGFLLNVHFRDGSEKQNGCPLPITDPLTGLSHELFSGKLSDVDMSSVLFSPFIAGSSRASHTASKR